MWDERHLVHVTARARQLDVTTFIEYVRIATGTRANSHADKQLDARCCPVCRSVFVVATEFELIVESAAGTRLYSLCARLGADARGPRPVHYACDFHSTAHTTGTFDRARVLDLLERVETYVDADDDEDVLNGTDIDLATSPELVGVARAHVEAHVDDKDV